MGEKTAVDRYRERQRRRGTTRARAVRKLAVISALVIATLVLELLILGFSADKVSWQTALIWSGFLWIGLGALLGAGSADTATVASVNPAAAPITARTLSHDRLSERDKQLGTMLIMMAVGAVLLLLYFVLTYIL